MKFTQHNWKSSAAVVACLSIGAISAQAQSQLVTSGNVIAITGGAVPGAGAGDVFGGTSGFDSGTLDENGNVLFRGQFQGTTVLPTTDRALFYGSTNGNLAMVIRSGDPAPTLAGVTLNTATGTGVGGSPRLASNGTMMFCGSLTGTGVTTGTNDSAIFVGTPGNFSILARRGDAAPGTTGATLSTAISNLSHQGTGVNNAGRVLFKSSTAGGDTVTGNNEGWFGGTAGNLELMLRKGTAISTGEVISALGFISQQTPSGVFATEMTLSQTVGTPVATPANDRVLLFYTPGGTPGTGTFVESVREGDPAPGTLGATFNVASNSWFISSGAATLNSSGQLLTFLNLAGGDVSGTANDAALYLCSASGAPVMIMRKGDPAPGTDGTFGNVSTASMVINNNGRIAFQAAIVGGTSTAANDTGIWTGTAGNLQLIAREGDLAVGTVGATMDNLTGLGNFYLNDAGQVTFQADLLGGDVVGFTNNQAFWGWDPVVGTSLLIRRGDQLTSPSGPQTVQTWGGIQFSNGDGRGLSLNQAGVVATRCNFSPGAAIVTIKIPSQTGTAYCFGDGTGTACPCANSGGTGRGCANSVNGTGAKLQGNGLASVSNDNLTLSGEGMPNGPGLYFQGTTQLNGGLGNPFGDGLRCAGGAIVRLGIAIAAGNASQIPPVAGTDISVLGGVASGDVRHYQLWYRDSDVTFCTANVFNLTNALTITWAP